MFLLSRRVLFCFALALLFHSSILVSSGLFGVLRLLQGAIFLLFKERLDNAAYAENKR